MRRILFTVMASAALCVAAPTVALARGGHHHKRHHHSRVRHEKFFAHRHASDSTGSPAGSAQPTAGTVTSFANNVLTITLANGSTVSGTVTNDTEISCENPAQQTGDNDGDDNGSDEQGDAVFQRSDGGGGGDQGDDDQGEDNGNDQMCTPAVGMSVQQAELTINGNGAFWNEVDLISTTPSTTSTGSGTDD
jgi:hypothetical protein